jgi:hypothetical protein
VSQCIMANPSYVLWSIWTELPTTARMFVPILAVVSIYSLFSATAILVRLSSIMNPRQSKDVGALQRSLAALRARSSNLRQLLLGGSIFLESSSSLACGPFGGRPTAAGALFWTVSSCISLLVSMRSLSF